MEITIETHTLTIIRTRGGSPENFVRCRNCETKTAIFSQTHAALIFRAAAPELERLLLINRIHFADDSALCGNSLAAHFKHDLRCVED